MRSLVALAVRRRVAVLMTALAVVAFGTVGYERLSLDLLPDISYPSLTVQTDFPDTAPSEVENLVTRPVEEAVGVLKGLKNIHSISRSGVSEVTLEFEWGTDMDMRSMDVRDKLDRLVLPEEADDPIVLRFDPSLDPIMRLALSGPSGLASLRRIADRKLKQDLETTPGVAAAQVKGGLEEEIQINLDQDRLAALGIPMERVNQIVGASNINIPGGSLEGRQSQYLIRTVNEYDTVQEIGNLVLRHDARGVVRLKDVADVHRGTKERDEITRVNGVESVEIDIFKEGDANTVTTAREVRRRVRDLEEELPPGHHLTLLFDQSRFIERAVREVRNAALVGGLLAVLVLFAFLRDLRSTLIIALSIPLSVVATFLVMYRAGISLNIMSLGGLTLGVGMLVDNSIVVLESIHRRRREGLSLRRAAVEGTIEVGGAVTASTFTTVAVFIPIVFVEGIAGQLFRDMALTVTFSLLASLLVAVTLIPMLSAMGNKGARRGMTDGGTEAPPESVAGGAVALPGEPAISAPVRTLGRFSNAYDRLLRGTLHHRWTVMGSALVLFLLSLFSLRLVGTNLIPPINEGEFFFEVNMPEGTPLAVTSRVIGDMEKAAAADDAVNRTYSMVGSRQVAGGASLNTKAENLGQMNVVLTDRSDETLEQEVMGRLRRRFEGIPDLEVKSGRPTYFSLKTPVEVILFGESLDELQGYSLELQRDLQAVPGLVDVRSSLEAGSPELRVVFDRDRVASLGLDMRTLSETLRDRVQGAVASRFREEDREIDIRVRNRLGDRATLDAVKNLVVPGPDGRPIRLVTVADVRLGRGPAEIHRIQQQRAAVVSADLQGKSLGSAVRDVERVLRATPPPVGVTAELGGQNQEMKVSYASLRFALALAIFLVYLVMAATFESLVHPFVVIFTIPLALVGVAIGLLVTGTTISVIVLIGVVMLAGIVVNNAIVLIDKINQLRRSGFAKEDAVIQAGHIRLRPILMTTLTTVLGLVPMALSVGEGAELRAPLAIAVSFGLFFSTLLTLLVIPSVYMAVPSRVDVVADEETGEGLAGAGSTSAPDGAMP